MTAFKTNLGLTSVLKHTCALFLLSFTWQVNAQPGGGGGLNISYLTYFCTGDTLELADENLKINHYVLNNRLTKTEYQFQESQINKHTYFTGERKFIYLPPAYYDKKLIECKNQRLEIIYKIDTMTIDFIGVMQENGAGHTEQMNCIQFFPGKYKMHLMESERFDSCWQFREQYPDQIDKLMEDMRAGILINRPQSSVTGWHILEETFNPNKYSIWARCNRENCREVFVSGGSNGATSLCESMMNLTDTHLYLSTQQTGTLVQDTLTLAYFYYFSFATYRGPVVPAVNSTDQVQKYPSEEMQLAQKYLDAFSNYTLYVNGNRYTGKIILFVSQPYYSLFNESWLEETHYYYKEGKLIDKYVPLRERASFNGY